MTVMALSGGVGGAKLALGLSRQLAPGELVVVVNTADDFTHLGLHVSPDLDTLTYTLAGLSNPLTGWGRADESWRFMQALEELGGPSWFSLGDTDLAVNVLRTARLQAGAKLSQVTSDICTALGVQANVLPMSDDPVRTLVQTDVGELAFQEYFVARQCEPCVTGFRFAGAESAKIHPVVDTTLCDDSLSGIIVCPSNPYISIDPMLSIPGFSEALASTSAPVVAVTPVVDGKAIKGPTTKMMHELGLPCSASTVSRHYQKFLNGFVIDSNDTVSDTQFDVPILRTNTVMTCEADKIKLAREVLGFIDSLRG